MFAHDQKMDLTCSNFQVAVATAVAVAVVVVVVVVAA